MGAPDASYLNRALFWLVTTTAWYLLLNGAQIFETALIVPAWTAAPPASLGLFHGPYALDFKVFWIVLHSLHEVTFVLALIFCWRVSGVRQWLLVLLGVHLAVRVWTVAYFVPTIIAFQNTPPSPAIDSVLVRKAAQWRHLNIIRVALFVAVNLALFPLILRLQALRGSAQTKTT